MKVQIGDYVILDCYFFNDRENLYINKNVGKVVHIVYKMGSPYLFNVKYNIDESLNGLFKEHLLDNHIIIVVFYSNIKHFGTKDKMEITLDLNKYNL